MTKSNALLVAGVLFVSGYVVAAAAKNLKTDFRRRSSLILYQQ
jgi:hypothetical protein